MAIIDEIKTIKYDIKSLTQFIAHNTMLIQQLREDTSNGFEDFKEEMRLLSKKTADGTEKFEEEMTQFKDEMRMLSKKAADDTLNLKREMEKSRKELNEKWGDLANSMGRVVEDLIIPNVDEAILNAFNCKLDTLSANSKRRIKGKKQPKEVEIDVMATSGQRLFLVETKTSMSLEYIEKFKHLITSGKFLAVFPEYKNYKITQIMASVYISDEMIEKIQDEGMFPMVMKGDMMEILVAQL
jgi:hypothetical protein